MRKSNLGRDSLIKGLHSSFKKLKLGFSSKQALDNPIKDAEGSNSGEREGDPMLMAIAERKRAMIQKSFHWCSHKLSQLSPDVVSGKISEVFHELDVDDNQGLTWYVTLF